MSQWRARIEDDETARSVAGWFDEYYHFVLGALLVGFMLWTRLASARNFVSEDGTVLFSGNDAWYHYRQVTYTVQNWPATMPFDPWTYFPHGTSSGQFGTFFDQLIATGALIVGLGSPDQQTIAMTLLVAPAIFAAVAAVPTYLIGKRLGGRVSGVVAVTVLALSAGAFLARSMAGFSDHHVAEALFQTTGVLAVMVAVSVAEREKPIYEQLVERDWAGLRPTLGWSALAGVAITFYLWVWPPGVLLLGIVGAFLLLQLSIDFVRGESPEHVAFVGAVTMLVTGVTILPAFQVAEITATNFSLLHPLLAFSVAGGCVFMAWLAREWEARDLSRPLYPAAVGGVIAAIALLTWLLTPGLFDYFVSQLLRVIGFTTSPTAGTVGEAQPLEDTGRLFRAYGFAVFVALVGGLAIVGRGLMGKRVPAEYLLVIVWAAFLTAATFTQARFQYYLVFPVAVLTGYVVSIVVDWARPDEGFQGVETYQVLTLASVLLVVVFPMLVVTPTAFDYAAANGPDGGIQGWHESLEWMEGNTPAVGEYNGSDDPMEYYGTYQPTDDYDYGDGDYGVMSWWDYGHWITTIGERIPDANPFQQGATSAANFLLAPNETQANDVLDEIDEDDATTRYVAVDWKMASVYNNFEGKYFAPPRFYDESNVSVTDYYSRLDPVQYRVGQNRLYFHTKSQNYYDSTLTRLYMYHGSAAEPANFAVDWERTQSERSGSIKAPATGGQGGGPIRNFNTTSEAEEFVRNDTTATVGGVGPYPAERVPAMEHYRLVGTSERSALSSQAYTQAMLYEALGSRLGVQQVSNRSDCGTRFVVRRNRPGATPYDCLTAQGINQHHATSPAWTKIFERVPGATVEGTGPANANVTAAVRMQMPHTNTTFLYRQEAQTGDDGEFEMTVPYSTTGYDEWGTDEGQTNVSVRADSSYEFVATAGDGENATRWIGTANVTEGQVLGKDDSPAEVEMEPLSLEVTPGEGGEAEGPTDASTVGNETAG